MLTVQFSACAGSPQVWCQPLVQRARRLPADTASPRHRWEQWNGRLLPYQKVGYLSRSGLDCRTCLCRPGYQLHLETEPSINHEALDWIVEHACACADLFNSFILKQSLPQTVEFLWSFCDSLKKKEAQNQQNLCKSVQNQQTKELIIISAQKIFDIIAQQQRPESPMVTLMWHASKYKVHKLHQRYIIEGWGCTFGDVPCIYLHARWELP